MMVIGGHQWLVVLSFDYHLFQSTTGSMFFYPERVARQLAKRVDTNVNTNKQFLEKFVKQEYTHKVNIAEVKFIYCVLHAKARKGT